MQALLLSFLLTSLPFAPQSAAPVFEEAFWRHWGDGRAEVSSYDLRIARYGEERDGTAVAIFVTETFSDEQRVKADPGRHPESDTFEVMKLNLAADFQTGIYDYNTMLSAFAALEAIGGRPAGAPAKVSFSSQEWCGHVYHQLLFDAERVHETLHSYFDGEADAERVLAHEGGLAEDFLWHWARGFCAPLLEPGESRQMPLLLSTQRGRFEHRPLLWREATLSRERAAETVEVPAGSFECDVLRVTVAGEPEGAWTFHVERSEPHRIVRWSGPASAEGRLVASERLPYWELQGGADEQRLEGLGLSPRPPRTP